MRVVHAWRARCTAEVPLTNRRTVNVFPPSANAIFWVAIAAMGGTVLATPVVLIAWARSPYATGQNDPPEQPVKFDHRHHVTDNAIDCEYCHTEVRRSRFGGIPATSTCMGCHAQIWTASPELEPVRRSAFEGTPIHWNRVHAMPDFVFFDHSAHVNNGVTCVTCHGHVERMPQVYQVEPLTMRWCLDCHRNEEHQRGRSLTHCTTCHR